MIEKMKAEIGPFSEYFEKKCTVCHVALSALELLKNEEKNFTVSEFANIITMLSKNNISTDKMM
jgi:hypothetical protein